MPPRRAHGNGQLATQTQANPVAHGAGPSGAGPSVSDAVLPDYVTFTLGQAIIAEGCLPEGVVKVGGYTAARRHDICALFFPIYNTASVSPFPRCPQPTTPGLVGSHFTWLWSLTQAMVRRLAQRNTGTAVAHGQWNTTGGLLSELTMRAHLKTQMALPTYLPVPTKHPAWQLVISY